MDIYDYLQEPDGNWIITKNGDFFLNVSGGKTEAEKIARTLREEESRAHAEKTGVRAARSSMAD